MDYATLKALKPSEFTEAADGYQSVSGMADHAYGSAEGRIPARLRTGLSGAAVNEALVQLRGLLRTSTTRRSSAGNQANVVAGRYDKVQRG
ncbi:hypothetical protein ACH4XT_40100 [Streptomyces avidinii]|uniref:hypothetical protein n=1 Tax=Streptomyces avidinii TaxID=1895 RepID=UPI00378EAF18